MMHHPIILHHKIHLSIPPTELIYPPINPELTTELIATSELQNITTSRDPFTLIYIIQVGISA
jgi:hypothetical protein